MTSESQIVTSFEWLASRMGDDFDVPGGIRR
jgi:hypothetical protein